MKVKVPKGSRQRRSARSTKLIDKAVISKISVMPRVGELLVLIIGQGAIKGEAYAVKKVSSENVNVSERMAGPSCRQDGAFSDLCQAARNGPVSARPIPSASPRCVGLSKCLGATLNAQDEMPGQIANAADAENHQA